MKKNRPTVILAGAGPGDPGLITRAAADVIRNADLVFHDALVSPELLREIPKRKRVNVGKRGGRPSPKQTEINAKLLRAAKSGRAIVRLKGGDPFVFGRGGEEASVLSQHGIHVRVIPGVTAAMAAAAHAGFPLTDRRCAASVTFLTASSAGESSDVTLPPRDWKSLVRLGGTWVFYMGLKALPDLTRTLIRAGADPRLPAAVISSASLPGQRVVVSDLRNIMLQVNRHGLTSPALSIVGRVVGLRPPTLGGKSVLVMRPEHQAGKLSAMLRERHATVSEIPAIRIVPIHPNPNLRSMILRLDQYDWILLTSANTVRLLKHALKNPSRRAKLAVVGPGTREALAALRVKADLVPDSDFRAEGLAEAILRVERRSRRFALPQAEAGREALADSLKAAGHRIDVVPVYRTETNPGARGAIRKWIRAMDTGFIPLTSGSMAKALSDLTRGLSLDHLKLVSIGPVTTREAKRVRLPIAAESPEATLNALVETIETVA